ncbi:MAG: bifunctional folylpolyglutamate synthase/dihydrofolate synthase [Paludibacteraceae bacterium]|nr:bifunctional folylpolyglutamate synthase/dihydrofolate synthase [Paludibacteraceae bacterium]
MTYAQTIDYLYASQPAFHLVGAAAYKPGLDNTYRLMAHLGNPHERLRAVHVAGTNGKGSTSHLIAAALQAQGYKVGLFTSPHLVDFRERIRISGEMIPEQMVVQFVANHRAFLDELRPSFFETTMAMAFWYFAQQQVDIAVVEVGLGGRLDSTNILTPLLSVITNIGIDHTEFLGDTLTQIAAEKAGIMKPHVPCVIGETHPETQEVFLARAGACEILGAGLETTDCRLWFADQCGYMRKRRLKEAPECQLQGMYQDKNQQTAFVALQVLRNVCGWEVSREAIANGFAHVCELTGLRGRWEILSQSPLTICDTGHNGHGIRYVAEQLRTTLNNSTPFYTTLNNSTPSLHIILGMVNDKDIDTVLTLLPTEAVYYFTQPATSRALPAEELLRRWQVIHASRLSGGGENAHGVLGCSSPLASSPNCYPTVREALEAAQEAATADDIIFIGGSNYVVGEVLRLYS